MANAITAEHQENAKNRQTAAEKVQDAEAAAEKGREKATVAGRANNTGTAVLTREIPRPPILRNSNTRCRTDLKGGNIALFKSGSCCFMLKND